MSHQPQLQIYNYIRAPHTEISFHPFPSLPTELRLQIWRYSMQRPRLIRVRLLPAEAQGATEKYRVVINGRSVLSKLLHVNHESREAALEFYRVHIPCEFRVDSNTTTPMPRGTFYFNPEYDILGIGARFPVRNTLLEFLHHLKHIHDPRRVGLLNLAMDINDLNANDLHTLDPTDGNISPPVRQSFTETLMQLREVFFVEVARAGRQIVGWHSGLLTSDTIFNRSFPIMATSTTFDRLPKDPREISDDLKHVFVGTFDPRDMFDRWGRLLRRWSVPPSFHVTYRFLLAFTPTGTDKVHNREGAERWLRKEDCIWKGEPYEDEDQPITPLGQILRQKKLKWPVGAKHEKYRNEDLENAVKPAFGFWLFPLEALGIPSPAAFIQPEGYQSKAKQLLDLTGHWPELALFSL
ncbi:2EXR domain-containing protein [Aspergillus ibericus CBS 121593]|uniref:2EXR domain-containing protein n=1 Tax=Aspergillus ibericus CBS 121593 TaxID=1448316 RepID=A0A395GUS8_9EURO|nr:hypothetical protein BO80DRAFT_140844 [Aspergillus ibericus CBS 121593]RAK99189.1 hypothetical protein BO80DRAFT_140844 [Aspergillus ibericus CBS 121593]